MEAASQRVGHHHSGRSLMSDCPRSFLDSIPSPISPAPPGSLGYVITKEHVDEMRRMEKLCAAKEEKLHREYKPVFLPVDEYLSKEINCELINVDIRSYPWKNTPFAMEAASQRVGHHHSGRSLMSDCPRSFLDSIPSPISPAPPGSLGYVITKEHVDEMRRMEKLCAAKEEKLHREYKPVFLPVDEYLSKEINCELINVDIRSYPWKNTPFGDVYYSPRYNDDRYTYRHVLLTNGVRKEAERVAATVPGGLLTEEVFVHYLGIVLSSGWSHFMLFNKQFKELILRRPK
ncbi:cyclin-dependent kinase, putative, partial [Eimeria acervulina]